jgi:6,7-dimethyl-8-ribityllumazine synthase
MSKKHKRSSDAKGAGKASAAESTPPKRPSGPAPAVAIVVSRYNGSVTQRLLEGAVEAYATRGGRSAPILAAPGSYELIALAHAAAKTGRFRGVVALGCLVKGETRHDEYIASAVAHGLAHASIDAGIPIAFGVLTVDTPKQAKARAGGKKGNKGAEAMHAVLDAIDAIDALHGMRPPIDLEFKGGVLEAKPDKVAAAHASTNGKAKAKAGKGDR